MGAEEQGTGVAGKQDVAEAKCQSARGGDFGSLGSPFTLKTRARPPQSPFFLSFVAVAPPSPLPRLPIARFAQLPTCPPAIGLWLVLETGWLLQAQAAPVELLESPESHAAIGECRGNLTKSREEWVFEVALHNGRVFNARLGLTFR